MKYIASIIVAATFYVASTSAQWTPSPLCPYPSENLTRFPYEGDCSKYWECYEGARYPMDCAAGLEFSADESRCDLPEIANCDPDATIIYPTFSHSTVSTTTSEPTQDPGPKPECPFPSDELTFYPVVNNCSQYWECFQGNRYLMTCPGDLYWNTLANYCDYPENVDCSRNNVTTTSGPTTSPGNDTTVTDVTASTTSEPPTSVSNETSSVTPGTTGSSETTVPVVTTETAGTTEPAGTPTTTEPGPTTTPNPICIGQPDGTYMADPYDCSKFYECVGGKAAEGVCPGDLVWNQAAHTCDYPENVDCDNSLRFRF